MEHADNISQHANGIQIESEFGYGFSVLENSGILTLYGGFEVDNQTQDELLIGTKVLFGNNMRFDLQGGQEFGKRELNATKLQLSGRISW